MVTQTYHGGLYFPSLKDLEIMIETTVGHLRVTVSAPSENLFLST